MEELTLGNEKQIKEIYGDKLHSKEPWIKSKKKVINADKRTAVPINKFNLFCKTKGYIKENGEWDYYNLVRIVRVKGVKQRINLNLREVYKMFNDNEKLIKKLEMAKSKPRKTPSDKNKIRLMESLVIKYHTGQNK